tara:strand:- start:858 stop:1220 length:363 start_codon:yes stop_codon:yes gene_type:complete
MPKKTDKDILKKKLIEAMEESLGVIKTACIMCKCSRQTYYDFMKDDKDFSKAIELGKRASHDFVRSKLFENITLGKESSIFFYMKTQMNWIEKSKVDITSNDESINIPLVTWVKDKVLQQ